MGSGLNVGLVFKPALNVVQLFTTLSVVNVVQQCSGQNFGQIWQKRGIGPKFSLAPPRAAQNQVKNAAHLSPALFFTGIVEIMAVWVSVFQQPRWSKPAKLGSFLGPGGPGGLNVSQNS